MPAVGTDRANDSAVVDCTKQRKIKLRLEYDGCAYVGWQVQKEGSSIQGTLKSALVKMTGEAVKVEGASRTDAGVHALCQCAAFVTESSIPVEAFTGGLNAFLPKDIAVTKAQEVPLSFDPRRDSKGKVYIYRVLNSKVRSPLLSRYTWRVRRVLDIERMQKAAEYFVGRKDFTSFRATGSDALHSVREITRVTVTDCGNERPGLIEFEIRGTAFLRHMVRIMAGTLVSVGAGVIEPADVEAIIEAKDRTVAPQTAPPEGLCLVHIEY